MLSKQSLFSSKREETVLPRNPWPGSAPQTNSSNVSSAPKASTTSTTSTMAMIKVNRASASVARMLGVRSCATCKRTCAGIMSSKAAI